LWGAGVTFLGYLLGNVPFVKNNIEIILIAVVGVSVIPIVIEYIRHRRETAGAAAAE
jgi:membrane-associated protein